MQTDEIVSILNELSIDFTRRASFEMNLYEDYGSSDHRILAEDYKKKAIALNLAAIKLAIT